VLNAGTESGQLASSAATEQRESSGKNEGEESIPLRDDKEMMMMEDTASDANQSSLSAAASVDTSADIDDSKPGPAVARRPASHW